MPGVWGAAAPQKNQAEHFLVFSGPNARFKLQILLSRRFVQCKGIRVPASRHAGHLVYFG